MYDIFKREMDMLDKLNTFRGVPSNFVKGADGYEIEVSVPGYKKEEINIEMVSPRCIKISGKAIHEEKDEKKKVIHQEFCSSIFERSYSFDESVKTDEIEATLDSGVLKLKIPFDKEKMEKKYIAIK